MSGYQLQNVSAIDRASLPARGTAWIPQGWEGGVGHWPRSRGGGNVLGTSTFADPHIDFRRNSRSPWGACAQRARFQQGSVLQFNSPSIESKQFVPTGPPPGHGESDAPEAAPQHHA